MIEKGFYMIVFVNVEWRVLKSEDYPIYSYSLKRGHQKREIEIKIGLEK